MTNTNQTPFPEPKVGMRFKIKPNNNRTFYEIYAIGKDLFYYHPINHSAHRYDRAGNIKEHWNSDNIEIIEEPKIEKFLDYGTHGKDSFNEAYPNNKSKMFDGEITNIKKWDKALTKEQIKDNYTADLLITKLKEGLADYTEVNKVLINGVEAKFLLKLLENLKDFRYAEDSKESSNMLEEKYGKE